MNRYTLEELKKFSSELKTEIDRREFIIAEESSTPYQELCLEEYKLHGKIGALRALREYVGNDAISITQAKRVIEGWIQKAGLPESL